MAPAPKMNAAVILAYALFDAENTTRLSEQDPTVHEAYTNRAEQLLYMLRYRSEREREFLAAYIRNM